MDSDQRPYTIEVNDSQDLVVIDTTEVIHAVRQVLMAESVASAEISVALVGGDVMQDLNRRFLDHDYDTDVLSFLLEESANAAGRRLEGEVIVSASVAQQQAPRFAWTPQNELVLYVVHGTLHLCGYDDQTVEEQSRMRSRERSILGELGLSPAYAEDTEPPPQAGADT